MKFRFPVKIKTYIFAMILSFHSEAIALPAYLKCELKVQDKTFTVAISADESTGIVTTEVLGSQEITSDLAAFSPESVKWGGFGKFSGIRYELSRVDLMLRREILVGDLRYDQSGQCSLQKDVQRAF